MIQSSATGASGLQRAIDAASPDPVILIWIRSKPRVTTLRPVAERLRDAGYRVVVAYRDGIDRTPQELGFSDDLPCFAMRIGAVRHLRGVRVCITSERDVQQAPPDCYRVGIHHSLPDHALWRNYAHAIGGFPIKVGDLDYYLIQTRQKDKNWTIPFYRDVVDRLLPGALVAQRRKTLAIVPFGYPKIDRLMAWPAPETPPDTITYAPTNSTLDYGSVLAHGAAILTLLMERFPDYRIAYRPYPGPDAERTRAIYSRYLDDPRFTLDETATGEDLTRRTAIMISDRSSVGVSFALGLARPVIFFEPTHASQRGGARIGYFHPIGLRVGDITTLEQGLRQVIANRDTIRTRIEAKRGDFIYNCGGALDYLVKIMPDILAGGTRAEWLEIPRRPFRALTPQGYRRQYDALIARVRKVYAPAVPEVEAALKPGFTYPPILVTRRVAGRILRKTPGLRRYLSRPTGQS